MTSLVVVAQERLAFENDDFLFELGNLQPVLMAEGYIMQSIARYVVVLSRRVLPGCQDEIRAVVFSRAACGCCFLYSSC